jgi:hypothetical protein
VWSPAANGSQRLAGGGIEDRRGIRAEQVVFVVRPVLVDLEEPDQRDAESPRKPSPGRFLQLNAEVAASLEVVLRVDAFVYFDDQILRGNHPGRGAWLVIVVRVEGQAINPVVVKLQGARTHRPPSSQLPVQESL